jgi:hypothetical protein
MLPVIKAARFSDTTGSEKLAVRERVFAPAMREEDHVDPQNQPSPKAVTIVTTTMQRGSIGLSGAIACMTTALMLLIQPQAR